MGQEPTTEKLKITSPKRNFDDSIGQKVLQVSLSESDTWIEVTEDLFRSWTGLRRINGEDYHGPIYNFGSEDSVYSGSRSCGCSVCQSTVTAALKVN
jgi:hypothetical protein